MDAVIKINQLTKQYKNELALDHFSMEVNRGEVLGIAGSNGAGKTTLFRLMAGLAFPTSGEIEVFGSVDDAHRRSMQQYMSFTIEEPAFFPEFTAGENLEYYAIQRGVCEPERVEEVLRQVALHDTGKKKFKAFSMGMRQRLAIALALLHKPEIMVFDEPTNGLDPQGIVQVRQLLRQLARDHGTTILVSSHILSELEHLADRFIILNKGKKVAEFSREKMQQRQKDYFELAVDQVQRASTVLEEHFHTQDYEVDEGNLIRIYDPAVQIPELTQALISEQIGVLSIKRQPAQLEDIFLDSLNGNQSMNDGGKENE